MPGLGKHRLDRLEPEHLERLYQRMIADGARPGNAHQVHRTARTAIGEAHRRGYVPGMSPRWRSRLGSTWRRSSPTRSRRSERSLAAAELVPNKARWAIALALGLRQGEVLGLRWADVDLGRASLLGPESRVRPVYEHGCGGTVRPDAGLVSSASRW